GSFLAIGAVFCTSPRTPSCLLWVGRAELRGGNRLLARVVTADAVAQKHPSGLAYSLDRAYCGRNRPGRLAVLAKLRSYRPSHATVVAYLALFVALGGSSYAAITVTGKNVKNSSLTGKDVKNNSLTGSDIKSIK